MDFAKFEELWAIIWEYVYKVLAYFGIDYIKPVA